MATLNKILPDGKREFKEQGARVDCIAWNEDGTFKEVVGSVPTVGCSMLVGSVTARSYSLQDYWLTTTIIEIIELERNENNFLKYCRFKTQNSEYEIIG